MERGERIRENPCNCFSRIQEWRKQEESHHQPQWKLYTTRPHLQHLVKSITTMTSEAERMKAQMAFMEEKADAADLRITILEAQCRKKDKEIKDLQNDCEKAWQMQIRKIINQPSKLYLRHPYRTRYQVRMMEDLTDLTLENEELKKEIKQMRAEMDK
ncbi:Dilute domain [Sesbania bispinosa]|nr:Dilute domain [Sesbania bispinosa]